MTEAEKILQNTATPVGGKIIITIDGRKTDMTWDEAWAFAQRLVTALELCKTCS